MPLDVGILGFTKRSIETFYILVIKDDYDTTAERRRKWQVASCLESCSAADPSFQVASHSVSNITARAKMRCSGRGWIMVVNEWQKLVMMIR